MKLTIISIVCVFSFSALAYDICPQSTYLSKPIVRHNDYFANPEQAAGLRLSGGADSVKICKAFDGVIVLISNWKVIGGQPGELTKIFEEFTN